MLYVTLIRLCDMLLVHESSLMHRMLIIFGNASLTEVMSTKFILLHWIHFCGG